MYKKIMLNLLFVPCMIVGSSDRVCQIEQLKKMQRDKEEEIVLIIKAIDVKENLVDSIYLKVKNVLPSISYEHKDIYKVVNSFEFDLQQALMCHKSIKPLLDKDFTNDGGEDEFELERIKYLVIRYTLEYMSLYNLIQQHTKILQELLDLQSTLDELQK